MNIAGKTALVTGAASGIGRASALALAQAGASVLVVDIDTAGGAETVRLIEADGGRAAFAAADVSSSAGIRTMFLQVKEIFGGVDIVHNNAGIVAGANPGWPETSLERISMVVATNLAGVIMGTRAAIDAMLLRGGVIVNTSAISALIPMPTEPVYAATKAGVVVFTQSCKPLKESHNIRVNAVLPPVTDTPILAKSGDGVKPANWLSSYIALTGPPIPPRRVAEVVLEVVRDDSLAGETCQVNIS